MASSVSSLADSSMKRGRRPEHPCRRAHAARTMSGLCGRRGPTLEKTGAILCCQRCQVNMTDQHKGVVDLARNVVLDCHQHLVVRHGLHLVPAAPPPPPPLRPSTLDNLVNEEDLNLVPYRGPVSCRFPSPTNPGILLGTVPDTRTSTPRRPGRRGCQSSAMTTGLSTWRALFVSVSLTISVQGMGAPAAVTPGRLLASPSSANPDGY